MKILITLLMILPSLASAHCPIAFEAGGEKYCTAIEWLNGEQKIKGQMQPSTELSPQMVTIGTVPQKWIYSKAQFKVWKDGDRNHIPQQVTNFTVFPYMFMESGHHHSTSFAFVWNSEVEAYELVSVAFLEMPGCWSLRLTTSNKIDANHSQHIQNIVNYKNLSDAENMQVEAYCKNLSNNNNSQPTGHDHGHHHH